MEVTNPTLTSLLPHSDGAAHLAFSPDGRFLYTSGAEGYMRIFDASDSTGAKPADPKAIDHFEDPISSLSASKDLWCAACDNGEVAVFTGGQNELASILTRCTLPIRSARFDPKGKWVVVASDELVGKVINTTDNKNILLLTGHKKGLRDATWAPNGNLITSTDADGEVRVWELGGGAPTCIKVFENLVYAADSDMAYPMGTLWHPSGKFFVVINKDNEIIVIERENWTRGASFTSPHGHTSQITTLAWSPNGAYLISAGKLDNVIIWKTATRQPVIWTAVPKQIQITDIAFHPTAGANAVAWVDMSGGLVKWTDVLPPTLPDPSILAKEPVERPQERSESVAASVASRGKGSKAPAGGMFDDETGVDDLGNFEDDDLLDLDDLGGGLAGGAKEDWIDDDLGVDDDFLDASMPRRMARPDDWKEGGARDGASFVSSYVSPSKGQEPFQPGSTPFKDKKRYLAFNMIGIIHAIEREDENILTVEFHDQSTHLGFHFNDPFKYSLAAIGELGAVFACEKSGDNPAMVYYRPYESWSKVNEWQYSLSPGENAVAVAVGGIAEPTDFDEISIAGTGTVVVATDKGYLRFFTGSGLQRRVEHFGDGDDIVSMAASKDWLLVVYRSGPAAESKQNLSFAVIDMDTFETVQKGRVPMRKGVTLKWIGFSDEQIPAIFNSEGVLSLLDLSRHPGQGKWLAALEMHELARREGKQESYWPIGVTDMYVNAIILKGTERHPLFPTPLFQEFELQFPLLRQDVQQGQLEELYARQTMFISNRRDGASPDDYSLKSTLARQELEADKHLIKLIQTACKAENLPAAFDATLMLSQPGSLGAAAKIAAFFHLPTLEERIARAVEEKAGGRRGDEENKRELKWTHRVDERTILAPTAGSGREGASGWFGSTPMSSTFQSEAPRRAPVVQGRRVEDLVEESTWGGGSDGFEADESMQVEEYDSGVEERSPKRPRSDGEGEDEGQQGSDGAEELPPPPVAPALKKATNPFSKRLVPKGPPPASQANPFAAKKGGKANDVKRTDSFFGRVEGREAPKAKGKAGRGALSAKASATNANGDKPKQTTLFGLPPVVPVPVEKAAKKRKSTGGEGDDVAAAAPKAKKSAAKPKAVEEPGADGEGEEEVQETQEDTQEALPTLDETQEDDIEMEETQVETQPEPEKENRPATSTDGPSDGLSKLAQFRAAPPVATSA